MQSQGIRYNIHGSEMQFVEVTLDPKERAVAEAAAMMYMDGGIKMQTKIGDASKQNSGIFGKFMGAGKRALTGENVFMTFFTNTTESQKTVAFSAPTPGKVLAFELDKLGGTILCQRESFLCAYGDVAINVYIQKSLTTAMFGGSGFVMQKLQGNGIAFVNTGGTVIQRELAPNEVLAVDTGSLVALQPSVKFQVKFVSGVRNSLFSGEGFYLTYLTGPGHVWMQSLPFDRLKLKLTADIYRTMGKKPPKARK